MFFTFINKENADYLDISALINFPPAELLYYYYNSEIKIPWEYYREIKEIAAAPGEDKSPSEEWLDLFDKELDAVGDLCSLYDNEFVDLIGPYYYLPSNTRFYFGKNFGHRTLPLNGEDLAAAAALASIPPLNKEIQAYYKNKKAKHKMGKGKEELLKDINLCLISLQELEELNKHINFWEKLLKSRYSLREQEDLFPAEPDNPPQKPIKQIDKDNFSNILPFTRLLPRQKKPAPQSSFNYNHEVKVYLIRYREYEKSCDRYKEALENWPDYRELFFNNCLHDIKQAEQSLRAAGQNRQAYIEIIQKSMVHPAYQDIETLESFSNYLNTGRANELQECLNIFEEERNWLEIKASQERIENTIHFLQSSNPDSQFADEHINLFLKHFQGKETDLVKAEL